MADVTKIQGYDIKDATARTALEGKQDTLIAGTNISIAADGKTISADGSHDIFWCTFGTTTYAEVTQALADGKFPVCYYGNVMYRYTNLASSKYYFYRSGQVSGYTYTRRIYCDSSGWSDSDNVYNELRDNKVNSISSSSTDTQYPSAKCVYDNLATKATKNTATATLTSSGWSNNEQTVSVTGVTASNTVIVAPAPTSQDSYSNAKIVCTAQASGTLTFTCAMAPSADITVNVVIFD